MAPTRALAKIRLLVGTTGGASTGDEDTVIGDVRDRLKLLDDVRDLRQVRRTLDYAAHPLVLYMQKAFPTVLLAAKTKVERAELFFELLKQMCSHTKHMARLALVVDDDGEWNAFEDRLELQFQGTTPARPMSASPPVVAAATRTMLPPPWWSRKWCYVAVAFTAVLSYAYVGSHYEMGRDRVMAVFKAAVGLAVVLLVGRVGPDALLEGTVEETGDPAAQQATGPDDDSSSDGGSQSSSRRGRPATPRASTSAEAEALQKLQRDHADMADKMRRIEAQQTVPPGAPPPPQDTQLLASSPKPWPAATEYVAPGMTPTMQMLANYASGMSVDGPASHTAARMRSECAGAMAAAQPAACPAGFMSPPQISAPPGLPGLPASVSAPATAPAGAWAPATLATRAQANYIADLFNHFEGQQSVNPLWCAEFWTKISELQAQQTLSPDLGRLLAKHGFFGAGTTAPPRADFRGELRALADTGAPAMGAGLGAMHAFPAAAGATGAAQADRWHSSLPLDLKRAAPEIYRSMRSQGAASAREWVDRQYRGDRSSHTWIDIWDLATEVDFRLRDFIEAKDDQGLFRTLAVDDGLEIKLRRLASFLYEARTGDRAGAMHMLAVAPPGSQVDIAPSWLVTEATAHSKAEHQRAERAYGARRGARVRGRGGAGGDGGRGRGTGGDGAASTGAGDAGDGRGGGRGRRGRRGRA